MKKLLLFFFSVNLLVACHKSVNDTSGQPLPASTIHDVSYGTDPSQRMDLYLPAGRSGDTTKMMVMVHGGAWTAGDKTDFDTYVPVIQQRLPGYAVANINYRLASASANHFPTQENDMKAALNFLVQQSANYHFAQKFVLLGASAGGHMVTLQAYKNASPKIIAVVDFFGPTDMTDLYNFQPAGSINQLAMQLLMNGTPTSFPALYQQSSPINFVTAQSPPTIILHGTIDDIVPIAQSINLKNKLQSFGVPTEMETYPNVGHEIWPDNIMTDAFNKIELFIKSNHG